MSSQMINEENFERCGSIDENGIVINFERIGMTPDLAIKELIANSIDAYSGKVDIFQGPMKTILIDNGQGMSKKTIENGFCAYHENHSNENTLGVSGIGLKTATLCLCTDNDGTYTPLLIYTYSKEDGYIVIEVPWNKIMTEKIYTNQVNYRKMNQEEEKFFKSKLGNHTGTIFVFLNTKNIKDVIKEYFVESKKKSLDKQFAFIFGKFDIEICLDGNPIKKYNYFNGGDSEFILKKRYPIVVFKKNTTIDFCIKKDDTYYDSNNNPKNLKGITPLGHMTLDIGCRNMRSNQNGTSKKELTEINILDTTNSSKYNNAYGRLSDYDTEFNDFNSDYDLLTIHFSQTSLSRNRQHITGLDVCGFKISSARADAASALRTCGIRSELSYETPSNQNNQMDTLLGIQSNKNQHSKIIPDNLQKIIRKTRNECFDELKKILKSIEQPSIEQPSIEQPIIEETSIEQPSIEETSIEQPSIEQPSIEQPIIEQQSIEQPSNEQQSIEQPSIEQQSIEQPSNEQGPSVPKYQKLPLSEKQLNEIIEKISENKNKACNDPHLLSYYNKNCL